MYRAIIFTYNPIPKTNIKLQMNISFGTFKSKEEAEKEANGVEKVILQTNPLALKIITKNNEYIIDNKNYHYIIDNKNYHNEYIIIDNENYYKSIVCRKVKDCSIHKIELNQGGFELLEDLRRYFPDGYSFRVVAHDVERIPVIIDEKKLIKGRENEQSVINHFR